MRTLCSAVLAALVLCGSLAWAVTDQEAFLAMLRKFGITDDLGASKKPCVCKGGSFDGTVGRFGVYLNGETYRFDCIVPLFSQGTAVGSGNCIGAGGSVEVLSK